MKIARRVLTRRSLALATLCVGALALGACGERSIVLGPDAHVRITDVREGIGERAEEGKLVQLHYTAALDDGTVIIDTYKRRRPHRFIVGDGTVIPGMDEGIRGMRSGGKRLLRMPPTAHYGTFGYAGVVPANAYLNFEVELVRVRGADGARAEQLHPNDPRRSLFGQQTR